VQDADDAARKFTTGDGGFDGSDDGGIVGGDGQGVEG